MSFLESIPAGRPGTSRTIGRMRELATRDARNWRFIRIATRIIAGCPHKSYLCHGKRILHFVKRYVQYVPDPATSVENGSQIELVQAPFQTLRRRAGDCDDTSTLVAALAMAVGIPARFATIKADKRRTDEFSHVYAELQVNNNWMGADASVAKSYLGWQPPVHYGKETWRI